MSKVDASRPRPAIGLVAGIAAGLVATGTLAAIQKRAARLRRESDKGLTVAPPDPAGRFTQYLVGGMLGGVYGVLAEYRPQAPAGFGTSLGLASAALADKLVVRAGEAQDGPAEKPIVPGYGQAAYLMYGITLDGFRRLLTGARR